MFHCSFCGKEQAEVRYLAAGPQAFICNECVELCREAGHGDNWRPIETAPKDDKPIDLWCEHFDKDIKPFRVTDVRWNEDSGMYPRGWWRCSGNVLMTRLEAVLTPTHWMPLPDAPSASRRAEPAPDAGREGK